MIGILQTETKPEVIQFVKDTNNRIENSSIVKSPFIGMLRVYEHQNKFFIYFDLKSLFPNIGRYVIFIWVIIMFIFHLNMFWTFVCMPFIAMEYFNTNYFFAFVMKKGLRKVGYKDDCKLIEEPLQLAMEMVENVPRRYT
jgi:hypothetical protein